MTETATASGPTPEELVAIVAAVELAWPRPVPAGNAPRSAGDSAAWRFSARWWSRAAVSRRERPWMHVAGG